MPFLMPVVGHGRKPDHPLGPSGSQVFKAMKRSGWFEYTLSDPRKRTATVRSASSAGTRRGAGQEGPEALDLRLLGHRPQAVRLGQGHLPEPIRGRASYRQMNQCRIRTTTPRFAVRFLYVAIGFLMRNLWCGSVMRSCRAPIAAVGGITWIDYIADDAALAPGGGVLDVRACKDSIV